MYYPLRETPKTYGSIQLPDGAKNVPVGKVIALLAEEGDDISNLEAPKEDSPAQKPSSAPEPQQVQEQQSTKPIIHHGPPPTHTRPLFPSVHRLVLEHGINNLDAIKGTGVRGMLTKGDVLTYLGKASGPSGTYTPPISPIEEGNKNRKPTEKKEEYKVSNAFIWVRFRNVEAEQCDYFPISLWMAWQYDGQS